MRCEGLLGDRGVAALGDLVEPAPDVAPAVGQRHRTAGASGIGQRVVGRVGVHLENAAEPRERPDGMLGAAARGVEIDHGGRIGTGPGPVVARDRPEIAGLGPPAPGIEHRRPGLVHEQLGRALRDARAAARAGAGARRRRGRPSPPGSSDRARSLGGRRSGSADRAAGGRRICRPAHGRPASRSAARPRSAAPARAPGPRRSRTPGSRTWAGG